MNLPKLQNSPRSKYLHGKMLNFTKRELEILKLTAQNYTAKEISSTLKISFRTVEGFIEKLKNKLLVTSKKELIQQYYQITRYPESN